jgi:hypothetical protein
MAEKWYNSKTKVGSVIFGVGSILVGIGQYTMGETDAYLLGQSVAIGLGAIYFGFGLRDAIKKN